MAEEQIDIEELRESFRKELKKEWELASQSTTKAIREEFQTHLDTIEAEGITVEEYLERALEHRVNEVLNLENEEE